MSTLTWLHLSDLHAQSADKFNRDEVVLKALFADIEKRIKEDGLQPDFVVFTGDVAYHGKAEEYDLAVEHFFEPLLETADLSYEELFIVPGNHDVDWSEVDPVTAAGCVATLTNRDAVNGFLSPAYDRSSAFRKFKGYRDFFNKYFGNSRVFNEEHYFYVNHIEINGIKIAILGLNSAWMSGFFRGPDDRVLDQGTLLIGERQMYEAVKRAQEADIRLALMHHPFGWLQDFDAADVESRLREACHFVLRGHRHLSEFITEVALGFETVVIPCGAVYDRREYPNGYDFVQLDLDVGVGTLYLRRWSDRRREWTADIDTTGEKRYGQFQFKLPKSLKTPQAISSHIRAKPPEGHFGELQAKLELRETELVMLRSELQSKENEISRLRQEFQRLQPTISPRDTEVQSLWELQALVADFKDAFGRCAQEAEQAKEAGRVNDASFDVIRIAWSDCKKFLYRLLAYVPVARASIPKEHLSELEKQVKNLDRVINEENRREIVHAVETLDFHLRILQETLSIMIGRHIGARA